MTASLRTAPRIGVLALQGDFAAHAAALADVGAEPVEVRRPSQLDGLAGLIIPGGESTALLKLMEGHGLEGEPPFDAAIRKLHERGGALFGTCAGMILLARGVTSPAQRSLDLIDIDVERNSYGRQLDSFEAEADWTAPELGPELGLGNGTPPLSLVFIRAPRLMHLGPGVEPLARCRGDVVLARQDRVLVGSFHPELTTDRRVHAFFRRMATLWTKAAATREAVKHT